MTKYIDEESDAILPYEVLLAQEKQRQVESLTKAIEEGKKTQMPIKFIENPKTAFGKLKPSIHYLPMNTMLEVAEVMKLGASKYGLRNWREQPVRASVYYDSMFRHMLSWYESLEDKDQESNQSHLAHIIANAIILLDAQTSSKIIDDRKFQEVLTK